MAIHIQGVTTQQLQYRVQVLLICTAAILFYEVGVGGFSLA